MRNKESQLSGYSDLQMMFYSLCLGVKFHVGCRDLENGLNYCGVAVSCVLQRWGSGLLVG